MSQKIRFYADEHIAKAIILGLRQRGVDILAVQETGMLSASDAEHFFKRAHSENRVIVTQDDDFLRFHAAGKKHSGDRLRTSRNFYWRDDPSYCSLMSRSWMQRKCRQVEFF